MPVWLGRRGGRLGSNFGIFKSGFGSGDLRVSTAGRATPVGARVTSCRSAGFNKMYEKMFPSIQHVHTKERFAGARTKEHVPGARTKEHLPENAATNRGDQLKYVLRCEHPKDVILCEQPESILRCEHLENSLLPAPARWFGVRTTRKCSLVRVSNAV